MLNFLSCFHGSSSKTGGPSTLKKTDKAVDSIFEAFCKATPTLLQTAVDEFIRTPKRSEAAVQAGDKIELALTHGSDPNLPSSPLCNHLSKAIIHDRPWLFQKLLNQPTIDINQSVGIGYPPLHYAIQKGNVAALQALLKRNATVSRGAIQLAALCGQPEMIGMLLAKLPEAADDRYERMAKKFQKDIKTWRNVSRGDRKGRFEYVLDNKFQDIAIHERLSKARVLLLAGADPNTCFDHGNRPLHFAVRYNEAEQGPRLIRLLLTMGADPNIKNEDGETPLYIAAATNNTPTLKMLLLAGADPHLANNNADTPLAWATLLNNEESIRALREAGAEPKVQQSDQLLMNPALLPETKAFSPGETSHAISRS